MGRASNLTRRREKHALRRRGAGITKTGVKTTKEDTANKDVRDLLIRALTKTVETMEALPHCDEDAADAVAKLGHAAAEIASALELENSFANYLAKEPGI